MSPHAPLAARGASRLPPNDHSRVHEKESVYLLLLMRYGRSDCRDCAGPCGVWTALFVCVCLPATSVHSDGITSVWCFVFLGRFLGYRALGRAPTSDCRRYSALGRAPTGDRRGNRMLGRAPTEICNGRNVARKARSCNVNYGATFFE